jgi:hypothetical protein
MSTKASKLAYALVVEALIVFAYGLGVLTQDTMFLMPLLFSAIYIVSLVVWKAGGAKFPFYFHIALLYLLASTGVTDAMRPSVVVCLGLTILCLTALLLLIESLKQRDGAAGKRKAAAYLKTAYHRAVDDDPSFTKKACTHAIILLLVSIAGFIMLDHEGIWIMISASAVLIGDEIGPIQTRSARRIVGALIGFFVCIALVKLGASRTTLILTYVIATLGMMVLMPRKYILGSACIGLSATIAIALLTDSFGYTIALERLVWTIAGAVSTVFLCKLANWLISGLDTNYEREKLIARS